MPNDQPTDPAVIQDPTPTERATSILRVTRTNLYYEAQYGPLDDRYVDRLLAALLADPALLFDLAVEAGALEQVGWGGCTKSGLAADLTWDCEADGHLWSLRHEDGDGDLLDDHPQWPVYRRVEPTGGDVTTYATFTEDNDWEGETWRFYIPIEGNYEALLELKRIVQQGGDHSYRLDLAPVFEAQVDACVAAKDSNDYMAAHTKLSGRLVIKDGFSGPVEEWPEDPFYKGRIADWIEPTGEGS